MGFAFSRAIFITNNFQNYYSIICEKRSWLIDWLIGASLSSYHEKVTVRYILDESAPA